jgi:hypothetical protein
VSRAGVASDELTTQENPRRGSADVSLHVRSILRQPVFGPSRYYILPFNIGRNIDCLQDDLHR